MRKHNLDQVVAVVMAEMGVTDPIAKRHLAVKIKPLITEGFKLSENCTCCGRPLTTFDSMKSGIGSGACSKNACGCITRTKAPRKRELVIKCAHRNCNKVISATESNKSIVAQGGKVFCSAACFYSS